MRLLRAIRKIFNNPKSALVILIRTPFIAKIVPDRIYLRVLFKLILNRKLDLTCPKTLNEKIQWMKLFDHRSIYVTMVDKYLVRGYVESIIGKDYLIPLLGVWDNPEEIDFDALPDKFVLKCNHNSGAGMCICYNKNELDRATVRLNLKRGLQTDYYSSTREWPYSKVRRRIVGEKLLEYKDARGPIDDYKFMCFDGRVDCVFVCEGRFSERGVRYHYFDREWKYLPYCPYPDIDPSSFTLPKPNEFEKMVDIAEKLSKGYPALRIDLYNVDGKIYFGEITLFTQSGFDTTITYEADKAMGDKFVIPSV